MWNKAKEAELAAARQRVKDLENEQVAVRLNRIDQIVDILGGTDGTEEIYEFRQELYDLFDRWHREDGQ